MTLREVKASVRLYLRDHYSDDDLVRMLEQAQSGSCPYSETQNCLLGLPTPGVSYLSANRDARRQHSLSGAASRPELAYLLLGWSHCGLADQIRAKRMVAIVKTEIWRRNTTGLGIGHDLVDADDAEDHG